MNDHRHSWLRINSKIEPDTILDDWLGPTLALMRCNDCDQPALLHLVGWQGAHLENRIFAIRMVDSTIRNTYLANINRDYCDLTRKTAETEALINASGTEAHLVLVSLPDMTIRAVAEQRYNPHVIAWQDLKPDTFDIWITRLTPGH